MLEVLKEMDTIRLNFSTDGLFVLNITLALIMFGVALDIKIKDFKQVVLFPKPAILGVISQFVLLPAGTTILTIVLKDIITPTIGLGMILVASCPGGNISNFITALTKGNAALSVTLTAFSTLFAIILTPLNFAFWGGIFTKIYSSTSGELLRPLVLDSGEMFKTVALLLGVPIVLGMAFAFKFPKATARILKPIKLISILAFFLMIVIAFVKNFDFFILYIKYIFIIVLIHNFIAFLTGYSFASIFKLPLKDKKTLTIETGIQNSGLALVLLFNPNIFPEDLAIGGMAFIAAWWGIWHILSGLTIAGFWSRVKV
ncbi:MAG: bile acid:sodium symporter family protein [Bacteroidales bacterium]|nr:bile acid:sodium symporter family protein [Bacteroidales bacterium]MCF8456944.1 bile acid:sodium symporter family protein [Bacteroidales bacterium]